MTETVSPNVPTPSDPRTAAGREYLHLLRWEAQHPDEHGDRRSDRDYIIAIEDEVEESFLVRLDDSFAAGQDRGREEAFAHIKRAEYDAADRAARDVRADLAKRIEELEAVIREVLDSNALDGDDLLWLDKKCRLAVGRDWPYLSEEATR